MRNIILKIIVAIVLVNGIAEVALSQVHILAATKLFVTEIGFYLFLFIIFGLTTAFNGLLLETPRGIILLIVSGAIASGAGFIYLRLMQADVAKQAALTMEDVQTSAMLVAASIVIYLGGSILISILSWSDLKAADVL